MPEKGVVLRIQQVILPYSASGNGITNSANSPFLVVTLVPHYALLRYHNLVGVQGLVAMSKRFGTQSC
jgi:hypothetical protein